MAYNPSSIRIQKMLGATKPIRPPSLPKPTAMPKLGSSLNLHSIMRPRFQRGGIVDSASSPFTGGILSNGAGRADDVKMHVDDGAYVVPAWAAAHLGEGNSINGLTQLKMMFGSPWNAGQGPWGAPGQQMPRGKGVQMPGYVTPPKLREPGSAPWLIPGMSQKNPALEAHGGAARSGNGPVPINASGGEFVIEPDEVARIGGGDINLGHRALDTWLMKLKKEAAKTIQQLPGPAK